MSTRNVRYYKLANGQIKSIKINKTYVKRKPSGFIKLVYL